MVEISLKVAVGDLSLSKEVGLIQGHTKDQDLVAVMVAEHGVGVQQGHGALLSGVVNYKVGYKIAD